MFRLEELSRLADWLAERAGRLVAFPRRNESEAEARSDRLTPAQVERLRELCAPDCRRLGGLYDVREGPERFVDIASAAAAR